MTKASAEHESRTVNAVAFETRGEAARAFPAVGSLVFGSLPAPVIQAVWGHVDRADGEHLNLTNEGGGVFFHRASNRRFRQISMDGQMLIVTLINDVQAMDVEENVANENSEEQHSADETDENDELLEEEEDETEIPAGLLAQWRALRRNQRVYLNKEERERNLACWNWALTGLQSTGVNPQFVFDYLHNNSRANRDRIINAFNEDQMQLIRGLAQQMRDQRMTQRDIINAQESRSRNPPPLPDDDTVREVVTQTGRTIVESHGFEVVNEGETIYAIVLQYRRNDYVSWEHWWIEADGVILQTVPDIEDVQVGKTRVHENEDTHINIRFPVRSLKPAHIAFIRREAPE
jgi:hypothetical protein